MSDGATMLNCDPLAFAGQLEVGEHVLGVPARVVVPVGERGLQLRDRVGVRHVRALHAGATAAVAISRDTLTPAAVVQGATPHNPDSQLT